LLVSCSVKSALSIAVTAVALVITDSAQCNAQTLARAVHITAENDYFDFWRPPDQRSDDNYTQGARISADLDAVPPFLRRLICRDRVASQCMTTVEVGQEMYTPTNDAVHLLPGERPYAGWLYLRMNTTAATARNRLTVDEVLGVTGPPSLAAQVQTDFHHLVHGFRRPLGWAEQLPTEADFAVGAEDDWYVPAPGEARHWADFAPAAHATVGTLRTAFGVGGRARMGIGLTHPWLVDTAARPWEAYFFVGGQSEVVARDLFLDGSTFSRSAHVAREPLIGEWERGIDVRLWRLGVEYRAVTEGREYRTGPPTHTFGGITLTWWIRR
jgi:lipid A 3-O-deacylase